MTKITYVTAIEIEDDVFVVEAKGTDGRWYQHEGPKGYAYFTAEQADRLKRLVNIAQRIDAQFWSDGVGGYGTDEHEYALLEAEYYEG